MSHELHDVKNCMRCGGDLNGISIMSIFDTSIICLECHKDEKLAPGYEAAHAEEVAQVRAGNYDYRGRGLTSADARFLAQRREQRRSRK
jgi:hypothetical protein